MALNCIFLGQNRLILAGFFCCLEKSSLWKLWLLMLEESRSFLWGLCTKCVILPFWKHFPNTWPASISQSRTTDAQWCLFSTTSQTFGPIGQIGRINFGVFSAKLSAPILALWVPCPWFPSFNCFFYKKLWASDLT